MTTDVLKVTNTRLDLGMEDYIKTSLEAQHHSSVYLVFITHILKFQSSKL